MTWAGVLLACVLGQAQPGEVRIYYGPYHPRAGAITVETNLVELGATLRDKKGTAIGGLHSADFTVLALTGPTRAVFEAKGIKAATSFVVPKGSYRIREVIREAVHNRMTASNSAIQIQ